MVDTSLFLFLIEEILGSFNSLFLGEVPFFLRDLSELLLEVLLVALDVRLLDILEFKVVLNELPVLTIGNFVCLVPIHDSKELFSFLSN